VALRLRALEERLLGHPVAPTLSTLVQADDLAELAPLDDARASAAYRRAAAEALTRDFLASLAETAARRAA
jgi:N-methylhydantoinase B